MNSVSIGKNCESIGLQAFEGCTGLKEITLSDCLTEIEDLAFAGCSLLESFDPPATLNKIGVDVFDECEQLVIDTTNCPAIDQYAKEHGIPTGFTDTNDYQLLKIIVLSVLVLGILIGAKVIFKKIKKSRSSLLQNE